ncbi:Kelch-like protein [Echinococcus granulosus]|uniref:Kelch-like protein n=1 Tax=Echinococcus granulosus TaxID=6210 RepID=W6UAT7_ECHGR|nr:Kelch-like protein [Echinococcus granulosus]EUB57661.1 Kelch-like protein [Echinococcus granulosus]
MRNRNVWCILCQLVLSLHHLSAHHEASNLDADDNTDWAGVGLPKEERPVTNGMRPLIGTTTQATTPSWAFFIHSHASCAQHKRHSITPSLYATNLQQVMETKSYSDETAGSSRSQKFCLLREQHKLIDLRITTSDGHYVEAHRLVVAATFPFLMLQLTFQCGEVAVQWRRFPKDIVEAAINYAYTGSIAISAANVARVYLLAHNLHSATIVEWCVDFLRTRTSLDNVAEVWSVANATVNRELVDVCLPLITRHFENLCLRGEMLMQTTAEYFEVLLDRQRQGGMSEETRLKAISKWLYAGRKGCDVEERAKAFGKLISKIDLSKLPPPSQTEYWKFVREYSESFAAEMELELNDDAAFTTPSRGTTYASFLRSRRRHFTTSWKEVSRQSNRADTSPILQPPTKLQSVPQLQPDESFNVEVPDHDASTVLNGNYYASNYLNAGSTFWSVNYRNGRVSAFPFKGQKRWFYSAAARNELIFIFGGVSEGDDVSTCEKLDTTTGEFTRLPDVPSPRRNASALNIPHIGIVVVGGYIGENRSAEMLVEDPSDESEWRWIKLNPMLEGRFRPGVAYFKGCVVVAGGDHLGKKITIECPPLTSLEPPTAPQWTRLHGVDKQCTPFTSLVTFDNRLIMLSSGWRGCDAYEFSPTEGVNVVLLGRNEED